MGLAVKVSRPWPRRPQKVEKTWGKYRRIVVTRWLCFERERVEWVN